MEQCGTIDIDQPIHVLLAGTPGWFAAPKSALTDAEFETRTVSVTSVEAAVEEIASPPQYDCVIVAATLTDADSVDLVSEVREHRQDLPIVIYPRDGSERLATDTLTAGAEAYVPVERDAEIELLNQLKRAIYESERSSTRRQKATQFETLFNDETKFAWILDPDGAVVTANETAAEYVVDNTADRGRQFCHLPSLDRQSTGDIEAATCAAIDGEEGTVHATLDNGEKRHSVEISFYPVSRDQRVQSIVVEAVEVTPQSDLEEELRQSERLHRITLNNMTDTVLVTDDEGAFTYVCPNVHFIFGYTAEEIHELGTIDELLGDGIFDESELADNGVLTNIECTATDKLGDEHALLVNVKEVSIQGGTRLFSCRDITKRKERERALTRLHDTARQLLYVASPPEAVQSLTMDIAEALPVDCAACYLYEDDDNVLRPMAVTSSFEDIHGPLPELAPGTNTLVGRTFVAGDIKSFDDVRRSEHLTNPTTGLRAAAYVPIGDHGVLIVGCKEPGVIDEVTVELVDLFAATAEAGLDRVDRESELRHQENRLQQRNDRLTKLNRTNDIIREIDRALVQAETREEIERAVCDRLTSAGRFALAWIGERSPTGVTVRTWDGTGQSFLDALPESLDESTEPTYETLRSGEPTTVSNVAADMREEAWRRNALSQGFQSVVSVPLRYEGATYGTMTVYATEMNAIDDTTENVLRELGQTIASAIGSVKRRDALLGGTVTELAYHITDSDCLLYNLADLTGGEFTMEGGVEQLSDSVLAFVSVEGLPVEQVAGTVQELVSVEDARPIAETEQGGTLRLELTPPFIATSLADHGALLRRFTANEHGAQLVIDVPQSTEVRMIDEVVSGWYDAVDLRSQRERTQERSSRTEIRSHLADRLTDRQLEAARTAYHSGYFDAPRGANGEEVAETLDVSSTAFYQLNRKAQRKLFSLLFDESGV